MRPIPSVASGAISTLGTVAAQALLREQSAEALAARQSTAALQVVVHQLYNPEGITQYNIVPGLLGVILQLTMVMMTSMALTREAERGTMENLLAMPSQPDGDHAGQGAAVSGCRRGSGVVVLAAAKALFRALCRFRHCRCWLCILLLCWRWSCLAMRFSTVARTQMQAMQLTFFFFLPSLLLSGFMFPYRGMPALGAGPGRGVSA
jgi:ABC-2 type transport system permease protein